jgi:hypothetical protein
MWAVNQGRKGRHTSALLTLVMTGAVVIFMLHFIVPAGIEQMFERSMSATESSCASLCRAEASFLRPYETTTLCSPNISWARLPGPSHPER